MSKVATAELQAQMLSALQALAPATDAAPIVPSDSADLAQEAVGIACGGNAGSVKLRTAAGNDRTIAIAAGQTIGIRFRKVYLTGTSATGLTALLNAATIVTTPAPSPKPSLSLSSAVIKAEGNSGTTAFTWTLTLNRDGSTAAYPFTWAVTGSGSNPADAADFGGAFPSGSGTFAPGETSKTITVLATGDTAVEPSETFTLTVTASGLNTVTSTGTISNDDSSASDADLVKAGQLAGVDYTAVGPQTAYSKKAGVDALPAGLTLDNTNMFIRMNAGATVELVGWDLSDYCVYLDQLGSSLTTRNCRLATANKRAVDVRTGATFKAFLCDFDGLKSATNTFGELIAQSAMGSVLEIWNSRVHGLPSDAVKSGSGFVFRNNYVFDAGYSPDGHPDFIQTTMGAGGAGERIIGHDIQGNLFDARIKNAVPVTCAARLQAEMGTHLERVTFTNNVYLNPHSTAPALYLGVRNDNIGQNGYSASDFIVANNWMDVASGAYLNANIPAPVGRTAFTGNMRFSDGAAIAAPASWPAELKAPLPVQMLYGFDAIPNGLTGSAGVALALDTSDRKAQGTAGFRLTGNSANVNAMGLNTSFLTTTADFSAFKWLLMSIDMGNQYTNVFNDIGLSFPNSYGYRNPPNTSFNVPYDYNGRGRVWGAWNPEYIRQTDFNGASIKSLGSSSKTVGLNLKNQPNYGNGNPDVTVDAFCAISVGADLGDFMPQVLLSMDDIFDNQWTYGKDLFAAYPLIKPTSYVPSALVGISSKMTLAQMQSLYRDYGWGMCVDSAPDDNPLTAEATLAESIAKLNIGREYVAQKFGPEGAVHLCYSFGGRGHTVPPRSYSCTSNGASPSVLTLTSVYNNVTPGDRIFDGGVLVGRVVKLLSNTQVQTDAQIAAGTRSFTFSALVYNITCTSDGVSTTITVNNAANIFAGMHAMGYQVQTDTRVLSVDPATNTVVVDKPIPAVCKLLTFGFVDGEYWPTKVADALIANGYKTGRGGPRYGFFTGFGVDTRQAIAFPAFSWDVTTTTTTTIAQTMLNIAEGRDTMIYGHNIFGDAASQTHYQTVLQAITDKINAGECRAPTVPEGWKRISARAPLA